MNFGKLLKSELILLKTPEGIESHWAGAMQGRMEGRMRPMAADYKRIQQNGNNRRGVAANYFSLQSFLVLLCLTVSLLILPLILPPLPPPPFMLLLLPVGIFVVLLVLAFMPSDVKDIASSYL